MTRRDFVQSLGKTSALIALGGGTASFLAWRNGLPPSLRGPFGLPEGLTFAAQRALLSPQKLAPELSRADISVGFPSIGTINPKDKVYQAHRARGFQDWRFAIEGLVDRPGSLNLLELRAFPSRTQVTRHICQEGWSAVAEWTGVPLHTVLSYVGIRAEARYVVFHCTDGWWDSLDMADALHPQTLLAYGMNGGEIPIGHGAPLRLRVERQLGYKSLKFIDRLTVTDSVTSIGNGKGSSGSEFGYPWYAGI